MDNIELYRDESGRSVFPVCDSSDSKAWSYLIDKGRAISYRFDPHLSLDDAKKEYIEYIENGGEVGGTIWNTKGDVCQTN